ncbi:MAG: hypothetical protein WBM71_04675 [Sedimenticolaceae bacterium]|jgi:hypothetical protein
MKTLSILVLSVWFLGACEKSMPVRESPSGSFQQLQGASLILKEPLEISADEARVFVQDGKATNRSGRGTGGDFDQYKAHCGFEIQSVSHQGFIIQPGRFTITRVQGSLQSVVMAGRVRVAGLQLAGGVDAPGGNAYHEGYHFWLASETQPEVMRMSCYGAYIDSASMAPPSLQDIRLALGAIAQIEP